MQKLHVFLTPGVILEISYLPCRFLMQKSPSYMHTLYFFEQKLSRVLCKSMPTNLYMYVRVCTCLKSALTLGHCSQDTPVHSSALCNITLWINYSIIRCLDGRYVTSQFKLKVLSASVCWMYGAISHDF